MLIEEFILHFFFTAEAMGYPPIPAFLDPSLTQADLTRGASFASAGSGYDDLTANISVSLNIFLLPSNKNIQLKYSFHTKPN